MYDELLKEFDKFNLTYMRQQLWMIDMGKNEFCMKTCGIDCPKYQMSLKSVMVQGYQNCEQWMDRHADRYDLPKTYMQRVHRGIDYKQCF